MAVVSTSKKLVTIIAYFRKKLFFLYRKVSFKTGNLFPIGLGENQFQRGCGNSTWAEHVSQIVRTKLAESKLKVNKKHYRVCLRFSSAVKATPSNNGKQYVR